MGMLAAELGKASWREGSQELELRAEETDTWRQVTSGASRKLQGTVCREMMLERRQEELAQASRVRLRSPGRCPRGGERG